MSLLPYTESSGFLNGHSIFEMNILGSPGGMYVLLLRHSISHPYLCCVELILRLLGLFAIRLMVRSFRAGMGVPGVPGLL